MIIFINLFILESNLLIQIEIINLEREIDQEVDQMRDIKGIHIEIEEIINIMIDIHTKESIIRNMIGIVKVAKIERKEEVIVE